MRIGKRSPCSGIWNPLWPTDICRTRNALFIFSGGDRPDPDLVYPHYGYIIHVEQFLSNIYISSREWPRTRAAEVLLTWMNNFGTYLARKIFLVVSDACTNEVMSYACTGASVT